MSENGFLIHPETRIGCVHLKVSTLHRAAPFYIDVLGLQRVGEAAHRLELAAGAGAPLIVLEETPGAVRKPARTTGLYHFAILVPSRIALARIVMRFIETQYPLQGASDHGVSEALYLTDPDGNGIEIYADRPSNAWPRTNGAPDGAPNGALAMVTEPLDIEGLLSLLGERKESAGLPPDTHIGHIHLHVSRLDEAERFYHNMLGFDRMQRYGSSAAFLSAGGYHHHIGINTWAGVGAPPPPANAVGLRHFTLQLRDQPALQRLIERVKAGGVALTAEEQGFMLADPSGNQIVLTAANTSSAWRVDAGALASATRERIE